MKSFVQDRARKLMERMAENGEPGSKWVARVPAVVPVGMDIVGRPFAEPLLFKIAAAYEAATHHRIPPKDFGPLAGEP